VAIIDDYKAIKQRCLEISKHMLTGGREPECHEEAFEDEQIDTSAMRKPRFTGGVPVPPLRKAKSLNCTICNGSGQVVKSINDPRMYTCPGCNGVGHV
jgi:hypothetical protein